MPTDESLLAEVPFFKLLDDEERKTLAEVLEEASFGAGEVLFKFGAPGDALYLIRKGRVELSVKDTTGAKVVLAVAEPGDFFGELSLLDGGPRTADAVALEHVELLVLDRDDLLLFFRREPTATICKTKNRERAAVWAFRSRFVFGAQAAYPGGGSGGLISAVGG